LLRITFSPCDDAILYGQFTALSLRDFLRCHRRDRVRRDVTGATTAYARDSSDAGGAMLGSAMRDKLEYIRCMARFYAFMDIRRKGNLFTANESPETLKKFSPITYLANNSGKIAPLFIARAGRDQVPTMNDSIDRSSGKQLQRMSRSRSPITRKEFMDLTTRTTMIVRVKLFKARLLS
jgi:hypothetical protein